MQQFVDRLFEAFNRMDERAVRDLMHPEIEFDAVTAAVVGRPGPYRGHAGMDEYFADVRRIWSSVRITADTVHGGEHGCTVAGRVDARAHTGDVLSQPVFWTLELQDGLLRRGQVFGNREAAAAVARGREAERRAGEPGEGTPG